SDKKTMAAARRWFTQGTLIIAGGILFAAASGIGLYWRWHLSQELKGPFRIGYFQSGNQHFRGPDGKPQGAVVDILNEAARRRGVKLDWVYSPEAADAALESGHVDLWPNLGDIPERRKRIYVTLGWTMVKYGLVSRNDHPVFWSRKSAGLTIARGGQGTERM